jgi:predicted dehydrogenase
VEKTIRITINGTGFAGGYTAQVYSMIPHKNGVDIQLSGVCSGHRENAESFAREHRIPKAFDSHADMIESLRPQIDNIACANYAHGQYVKESASRGVSVIVLEKPPIIWPGYHSGNGTGGDAKPTTAETKKIETMAEFASVLDAVRKGGSKLLYAEDFVYFDGVRGLVQLLKQAMTAPGGKGRILYQHGVCAHQGSHAPAYDSPHLSGGGALMNKACHPLGPILFSKQIEGLLRDGVPIRPARVSATVLQILKHQGEAASEHFRVMNNVEDYARITVVFEDKTVAEVSGYDLSISGIRNELKIISDFGQYDIRANPNNANEIFLPDGRNAGSILFREKLPTSQGTSFAMPNQFHAHGYVNEMEDAVDCALDQDRPPQSGALMAWDTLAVLMGAYESGEKDGVFVDIGDIVNGRIFQQGEMPDPSLIQDVYQSV